MVEGILPRWWWAVIVIFALEASFVYYCDKTWKLGTGVPTYIALAGLAFVFAPTFFQGEEEPIPGGMTFVEARKRAEMIRRQKELKKKQSEKKD